MTIRTSQSELLKVIGVRGLSIFSGLVREEYLTDLRSWLQASKIYREMADDAIIGTLLDAIRLPLLAADFDVPPISEADGDKRAAEFLWQNMTQMDRQTWRAHVNDMMDMLTFGFSFSEVVMEKRDDGRMWLKNLEPRGPETLVRWEWDRENDAPVAFVQRDPSTGVLYSIPVDKGVHMTFNGRKGNPQGKPLLRSLFRPWLKLKYLENFEAIGIERDVGGMAVVDVPDPDKVPGLPQDVETIKDMLEDAFKNLRMDENMWLFVPPGFRAQSWGSGQRTYNVREAIVAKQKEILLRFFAQFLMLEHAGLDASGLLKGSQDFFALALKSIQQEILESWQQQLVPLLFEFNHFLGMTELPVITWNDAGRVDVTGLVTAMTQAIQGQVLTPTRGDEEHVRALMDLPDLPEGEGEGPRTPQPTPTPFLPFAEHPAGQRLRVNPDRYDRFLNDYQKELVGMYDAWDAETQKLLVRLRGEGISTANIARTLDARLEDLEVEMMMLGRRRIFEAGQLGLGKAFAHRADSAGVRLAIARMQQQNDRFLAESLIPDIRSKLTASLREPGVGELRKALQTASAPFRSRVAGYAGGATVAVFEVQKRAGIDENAERRGRGEPPVMVRWNLTPDVEHCEADPKRGTFGCPDLARVYEDYSKLPTVPAGAVSCLGNCRCFLTLSEDGGRTWFRP